MIPESLPESNGQLVVPLNLGVDGFNSMRFELGLKKSNRPGTKTFLTKAPANEQLIDRCVPSMLQAKAKRNDQISGNLPLTSNQPDSPQLGLKP